MLYHDRIDISKVIDLTKSNNSKECDLLLSVFKSWIEISRFCMSWLPYFGNVMC